MLTILKEKLFRLQMQIQASAIQEPVKISHPDKIKKLPNSLTIFCIAKLEQINLLPLLHVINPLDPVPLFSNCMETVWKRNCWKLSLPKKTWICMLLFSSCFCNLFFYSVYTVPPLEVQNVWQRDNLFFPWHLTVAQVPPWWEVKLFYPSYRMDFK